MPSTSGATCRPSRYAPSRRSRRALWPRRTWPLFLVGGLVALNNTDFGIPAVGGTIAALLWTGGRPTAAAARRLALAVGLGLTGAVALVSGLVVLRTGAAPHFWLGGRYASVFAIGGFGMMPIRPLVGLSTILFLTFVATIAVATVRAQRGEPGRALTGMLVWSGVFGLGAGSYYVGRSIPELVTQLFPSWALALTLLTLLVVQQLAARTSRRPSAAEVACLFGFGLLVCSLGQTPAPWSQVQRLQRRGPTILQQPPGQSFVAARTKPGEHVVVLMQLGHRIAVNLDIDNVSPYTGSQSIQIQEQFGDVVDALRNAGGRKLFLSYGESGPAMIALLQRDGFGLVSQDAAGMQLWVAR